MPPLENWLWLSLHPHYADLIVAGMKRVELRRARPLRAEGATALLYSTSPVMSILGECTIESVEEAAPARLWKSVALRAGVNRAQYDEYFKGSDRAVALQLGKVRVWRRPVTLEAIRRVWPSFAPPQSFRYLTEAQVIEFRYLAQSSRIAAGA